MIWNNFNKIFKLSLFDNNALYRVPSIADRKYIFQFLYYIVIIDSCNIADLGGIKCVFFYFKNLYLKYYISTNRAKNRFPCKKKRQTRNRYLVYFVICGLVPLALKTTVRQPYWKRISCPVRELDARRHYTAACRRSTLHTNKHIGRRNERCSFPKWNGALKDIWKIEEILELH